MSARYCGIHHIERRADGRCPRCQEEAALVTFDRPPQRTSRPPSRPAGESVLAPPSPSPAAPAAVPVYQQPSEVGPFTWLLTMIGLPSVHSDRHSNTPWATLGLCAAIATVYGVGLALAGPAHVLQLTYTVGSVHFERLITSLVAHFSPLHLLGNLWFLFVFGRLVESGLSRRMYLGGFVVIGVLSTMVQALVSPDGMHLGGASGAVAGVMAAALIHAPEAEVSFSVGGYVRRAPMLLWVAGWLFWQLMGNSDDGIGYAAHLSGFAMGFVGCVLLNILEQQDED